MLTLPLDPTDDRAAPAFRDRATCSQWLGQLQLTNLQQAQATLRTQLDEFNRYPMRGLERMRTLELLGETVGHVQHDYARKLMAKSLPLNAAELAILESIVALWQGMVTGYQRCLQAYVAGDQQLVPHGALLCHRCLNYSGLQILEHLQAGYEFDGALWQQLHALYAFAEEQELQLVAVKNEPSATNAGQSSCRTAYLKLLLICHAHPFELSRSQLHTLDRWLSLWSDSLAIEHDCMVSRGEAPPLVVDLDSAQGLQPLPHAVSGKGNLRYLPMVPMSKLLRVKTILLQQGQSPQQLELGASGKAEECAEFLGQLHRYWCEARPERRMERVSAGHEILACYEIEAIYSQIAKKPFRAKQKGSGSIDMARNQIATFGRVLSDTGKHHDLAALGYIQETWITEDVNILGARMLRQDTDGVRLKARQLVATHAADAACCTLGVISWINVTRNGQLHAGIRYLPGTPQAVAVKTPKSTTASAALLLPAMPELGIPASLIVPRNLFEAGGALEIVQAKNEKKNVKMGISVEKGMDYERVSFVES